jgi:two-component system cell cycle sensor histidine kinase/response regulator CckA
VEKTVCESVPDCLVVANKKGDIVFANSELEKLFGFQMYEVVGEPVEFLFAERPRNIYTGQLRRFVESNPPLPQWFELLGSHKSGRSFPVQIRLGFLKKSPDIFIVNIIRDLTERENLREQLRQSQKMEALALLAAGATHDFNNLLTVINGCSRMLIKNPGLDETARLMVQEIHNAGERAAHLTRRLLTFSRNDAFAQTVLNLNAIIADTETILPCLLGKEILVSTVLHPDLGFVKADACQIEQIILNLVMNARDAMPHGGTITIETANVEINDTNARMYPAGVGLGKYVKLVVTDTGCGMDEKTKARIFEPLFTTKEPGKGTGLGLSTVAGIVKENGGHVTVASKVGRGAAFTLLLPRVDSPGPAQE